MKTPFLIAASLAILLPSTPLTRALPDPAEAERERPEQQAPPARERPEADRPAELRPDQARHIQELQERLERLQTAGKEEEAAALRQHLAELKRSLNRERPDRPGRPEPDLPALHLRLEHLRIAIEHLHVAGFHEPAEHLQQTAQQMERELHARQDIRGDERVLRRDRPGPNPEELQAGLERLQAELNEMRHALREMNARLENMTPKR